MQEDLGSLSSQELAEKREAILKEVEQPEQEPEQDTEPEEQKVVPEPAQQKDEKIADDGFVFDSTKYQDMSFSEEQLVLLEKKDKQIYHEQKMIQRQSQEVAEARRKELEIQQKEIELQNAIKQKAEMAEQLKDNFYSDPVAYEKAVIERNEAEKQLAALSAQRGRAERQKLVMEAIPEFMTLKNEIAEVIRADMKRVNQEHLAAQYIDSFNEGNWTNMDPLTTIAIAERAKLIKTTREYEAKLKSVIQTPDVLGKKLATISNQRPVIAGGTRVQEKTSFSAQELNAMTREQLQEAKRRLLSNLN